MPLRVRAVVRWCVVLSIACTSAASTSSAATIAEIRQAIEKGKTFLYSVQKDGNWEIAEKVPSKQTTGQTALVVYALLASGESPNESRLAPAIDYLKKNSTVGVYALGMRCQVWLLLPHKPDVVAAMNQDAKTLLSSVKTKGEAKGMYFYTPGPRDDEYDHSGSQYGVLGTWAAAQMGVEIPAAYWAMVEEAWIKHQDPSGGWAYEANHNLPNTPGMTAVGVASLYITQEYLHANDGIPCKGNIRSPSIERGVKWLAENFSKVATNERYPRDYPYATIYAVERVGLAGGLKYFGNINWYEKGANWLVKAQRDNGAWPEEEGMPHFSTSEALLFLSRGSAPVMMNKLDYSAGDATQFSESNQATQPSAQPSPVRQVRPAARQQSQSKEPKEPNWNQRPRDAANIARWTGQQIEHEVNWQVVNLNAPAEELHDAPILYMAGNEALRLTPEQEQKLKTFIEQGGLILANADCGAAAFTSSFKALATKLFPLYELSPLPDTHPIYTNEMFNRVKWKRKPAILGVRNGARELMILLPTADAGKAWQMQQTAGREELFQLAADTFLYAVDKQATRARGESHIVIADPKVKPSKPIRVARLSYQGNPDPEPGGWRRLAAAMHNESKGELTVEMVKPDSAKLDGFDAAHLTGTVGFALTQPARDEIKRYVTGGGTVVIDAAGGSGAFATSAEKELAAIFGDAAKQLDQPLPPDQALYSAGGTPLGDVGYRTFARSKLGMIKTPQLRGITVNGRLAVIYSREDLSVGLVGQQVDGIIGYDPATATALMTKALVYAAGRGH